MRTFLLAFLAAVAANPIDLRTQTPLTYRWLETGFVYLDAANWLTVTTKTLTFNNPVVLASLPDIPGETHEDGFPTAIRVRNRHFNADDSFSFELKVYLTNDSHCSTEWYVPEPVDPPLQISWIVAEYGAYNISNYYFIVGTGELNRTAALYPGSPDFIRIWYPTGCNPAVSTDQCQLNTNAAGTGAVATIQTLVYDRFLMVRVSVVALRFMRFVLNPHDAEDPNYYVMHTYETMGYLAFHTGISIKCVEKLTFETVRFGDVTSTKKFFDFAFNYAYAPGVYGMLLTYSSLAESTGLRVFDRNEDECFVITQEDQCVSEQTVHTTNETVSVLVVGETVTIGSEVCQVRFNSALDSSAPTAIPTKAPTPHPTEFPTSEPSSIPTSVPSSIPTSNPTPMTPKPTVNPTFHPTSVPTDIPTAIPTSDPTSYPTAIPTLSPTFRPTAFPTFEPTHRPTGFQTCVEVFLYDLFGDGWGSDIALKITRDGVDTYYTPNCTCDMFPVCFRDTLDLTVVGVASPVRHSWEAIWAVRWPVNNESVGGFGSEMHFLEDYTFWASHLLDYKITDKMQCERCEHPPPKRPPSPGPGGSGSGSDGSGAPTSAPTISVNDDILNDGIYNDIITDDADAGDGSGPIKPPGPKKPPALKHVPFVLFDTQGDGWYNESSPADTCGHIFPNLALYPKYYIITKDRARVIHSGTICGDYEKELCHEKLPEDGEFVWRVAGYEDSPEQASWHFCGVDGTIGEEVQFAMRKGKCVVLAQTSASDYCDNTLTMVTLTGSVVLTGVPSSAKLTKYDTALIEDQLLDALHGNDVALTSWNIKNKALTVYFSLTTCSNVMGYNGLYASERESFVDFEQTKLSNALTGGYFISYIQNGLRTVPNSENDLFYHVTSAALESLKMESFYYVHSDGTEVQQPMPVYDDDRVEEVVSESETSPLSFSTPLYAFAAVLGGGMLAVLVVSRALRSRQVYASLDSTEDVSQMRQKTNLPPQLENEELFYFSNRNSIQRQDSAY